jgi:hypothetical protein
MIRLSAREVPPRPTPFFGVVDLIKALLRQCRRTRVQPGVARFETASGRNRLSHFPLLAQRAGGSMGGTGMGRGGSSTGGECSPPGGSGAGAGGFPASAFPRQTLVLPMQYRLCRYHCIEGAGAIRLGRNDPSTVERVEERRRGAGGLREPDPSGEARHQPHFE